MTCKKCGSALSPNANFCHHCGEVQEPAARAAGGRYSEPPAWAAAEGASGSSAQPLREPQPGNASTTSYPAPQYNPYYNPYNPYSRVSPNDAPHIGYAILCFFFPIVGLILYLVWKDEFPQRAKSAGKGALVGVISGVVLAVLAFVFWFGLLFWIIESSMYY